MTYEPLMNLWICDVVRQIQFVSASFSCSSLASLLRELLTDKLVLLFHTFNAPNGHNNIFLNVNLVKVLLLKLLGNFLGKS